MIPLHDCLGLLACMGNPNTGFVECVYKGHRTSTTLEVGKSFVSLDSNQFIWTRVSDDAEADALWNSAHYGGTKEITITTDDVNVRATFFCDLIDAVTRRSLL